ncbi:MAG: FCD domain-containing protein [Streptosporangiales bacterium]|nr:FCD domain-containing protein [Streptosporangiales bacterium]
MRAYLDASPEHGSTTDVVTDALREAILDGALPPSRWLREDELARELSVSRTPVREALRRLSDERLIVRAAHRGSLVAPMTFDDVLAVYLVRESLEGLAAQIAARRRPAGLIDSLSRVHRAMTERAEEGGTGELVRLNLEFHRLLREASGNPYLERFLTQVEHAVRRFGRSTYELPGRVTEMLAEHRAILDAIAAGDADAAQQKAAEHMRRARDARVQGLLDA